MRLRYLLPRFALGLVVAELLLRFAFTQPVLLSRVGQSDASCYYYWLARHRGAVGFTYAFDIYDPQLGWRSKPKLRNFLAFDGKMVSTNRDGLRGTNDFLSEPGDRPRILFLGDSFTFGDEVGDHETYCHYLQEIRPDLEIVNMGVHGYGHDQMLLLFRELGRKYKPDYVFLGYLAIDRRRNLLSFRDFSKPKFELKNERLVLTNSPVESPEAVLSRSWARVRLVDFCSVLWWSYQTHTGGLEEREATITTAILRELEREIRAVGAEPVYFYLSGHWEPSSSDEIPKETFLKELCEARPLPTRYFSVRPSVETEDVREAKEECKGHWGPLGNRLVAEGIARHLPELGLPEAIIQSDSR